MRKLLLIACFLFPHLLLASHIVGGEFSLEHLEGYRYNLKLVQYFDEINGNPEAEDDFALVFIYRKSDDVFMTSIRLDRTTSRFVPYTNPECSIEELIIREINYAASIELPPAVYNDPQGYYVVYERCCRNYVVNNLARPEQTGQTFYMEFPPVTAANRQLVNSSPKLSSPLSDYACINELFTYDFGAIDADGDSLVYSLSSPLNSSRFEPLPMPSPAPHSPVVFSEGIGINNMVPGSPALNINQEGRLSVRPNELGLFVFGIKVEEYRNGLKIGEVRRDYQMLVVDCSSGSPPVISGRIKGETVSYQEGDTIRFTQEDLRCLEFFVTDPDPDEQIRIKAEGVNFSQDIQQLIPSEFNQLTSTNDTLSFEVCLPECPYTNGPMLINIIALDDACSQPLTDTLTLTVLLQGPVNENPFFVGGQEVINFTLEAGQLFTFPVRGVDNDKDLLFMEAEGVGFDLEDLGMQLQEQLLVPGEVQKSFVWTPDCATLDLENQEEYEVRLTLTDDSECSLGEPDELLLRFKVEKPANERPLVSFEGLDEQEVSIRIDETLSFNVIAEDFDGDFMTLSAIGDGFELEPYNINFAGNQGLRKISSPFNWRLSCNAIDLAQRSTFDIFFVAQDRDSCIPAADTLKLTVNVLPPLNNEPELILQYFGTDMPDTVSSPVGRPIVFDAISTDQDNDIITLRLARAFINESEVNTEVINFNFNTVRGRGLVRNRFLFQPSCDFIPQDRSFSELKLIFVAEDSKCFNIKDDSVQLVVQVFDEPLDFDAYEARNAFTPNGDGQGDFFFLRFCNDPEGECDLPQGNCLNEFERIEIFNRWGRRVFTDNDINFQWDGAGMAAGTYFYHVYYTRDIYKGQVYLFIREPD
ncbi:MAG: gliding motility-associated C-terminal domain-containing protein [Cyclobacteriaceae bacterium]